MSIEGGNFRCYLHADKKGKFFETASIEEWNAHCSTAEGHTEMGVAICQGCGEYIEFSGLPFHPLGPDGSKNIRLTCDDCGTKKIKGVKTVKLNVPKEKKK